MLEKWLIHRVLSKVIRRGGLAIRYWDGTSESYGPDPAVTIEYRDLAAARSTLLYGTLGVGEAYSKGQIEITGSIGMLAKVMADNQAHWPWVEFAGRILNNREKNCLASQKRQIEHHYDIGNDFYKLWLDRSMTYSCAYFRNASDTLEIAQEQKRSHILRKLQLKPGMTLLDIGSGWGQLAIAAAQQFGVNVVGITLSSEQYKYSTEQANRLGLANQVQFERINYQVMAKTRKQFDRIVSVGMFEHVGQKNHHSYFNAIRTMLRPDGLSLLHTISADVEGPVNPWIDKYIFPGGYIPSWREVIAQLPEHGFRMQDYESLAIHYAMTIEEWLKRYELNMDEIRNRYDESFARMWRLYLGMTAGCFRWGVTDLSQIVFTRPDYKGPLTRDHIYQVANTDVSQITQSNQVPPASLSVR